MKKITILLMSVLFIFNGCATLKNRGLKPGEAANNKSTLTHSAKEKEANSRKSTERETIPIVIGFKFLEDKRPKKDIIYMTSVKENVSSQILKAIKTTQVFSQINFPFSPEDGFIISGEILKFDWGSYDTMISYIPGLNVLNFFALPSTRTYGEVEIYLELREVKSDKVIFSFVEKHIRNSKYNIYNFKPNKADDDLAFCFNIVLGKIKDRFLLEKNNILEAVSPKKHAVPESKKVQGEELPAVSEKKEEVKTEEESH